MGGIKFLLVEVWIEAFSTTPEQINKFDWLGSEIGAKMELRAIMKLRVRRDRSTGKKGSPYIV